MDDATNIFRLFPGRTTVPHNGFKSGRDIEFGNDDLAAIQKNFAFQLQYITPRIQRNYTVKYKNKSNNYGCSSRTSAGRKNDYDERAIH